MIRNLLLISNSTNAGEEYLAWPKQHIHDFLIKSGVKQTLFIPYAGINLDSKSVEQSYGLYEQKVQKLFGELGFKLHSIHHDADPVKSVEQAEAVVVGGGNTFHLVNMMHRIGIMGAISKMALEGMPYVGWSAGANVACPTMKTTNDMPVCEPPSFNCLNLVPFQINPHYLDANPSGHAGETREQRILEYLQVNRNTTVVGLREGCLFTVSGSYITLTGSRMLRVFNYGKEPKEYASNDDLGFLMRT